MRKPRRTVDSPSMAEAAHFLRDLSELLPVYQEWPEEKRVVKYRDLTLMLCVVADCIEKKRPWRERFDEALL